MFSFLFPIKITGMIQRQKTPKDIYRGNHKNLQIFLLYQFVGLQNCGSKIVMQLKHEHQFIGAKKVHANRAIFQL